MTEQEGLNIAFVTEEYLPENAGGAGISSKLIVTGLRDRGISVDVFALSGDDATLTKASPSHFRVPSGRSFPGFPHVGTALSSYRHTPAFDQYDLVHCYGPKPLPGIVCKSSIPVVATFVNFAWVCTNPIEYLKEGCPCYGLRAAIENARAGGYTRTNSVLSTVTGRLGRHLANHADALTVQTEGMRQILTNCGYDHDAIAVIPNLLDTRFEDSPRTMEPEDARRLVFVGRLVERKGALDVVQAFAQLPDAVREGWSLRLYGDGPQRGAIEELITEYDIDVAVDRVPYQEMPATVYGDAAAVVHASKYPEPFSRVWLEAMATGTPLVCSENPSSRSVLDGVAEFFDPSDISTLVSALQKILQNPSYRAELSRLGSHTAERYLASRVVPRYVELYDNVTPSPGS